MTDESQALWSSYKRSQAEQAVALQKIPHEPTPAQVMRLLAYATAAQAAIVKLSQEMEK